MIQITNAELTYGGQVVFDGLNLTCYQGQRVGLLGRNGAGKSTLLKAISGQLPLDGGTITLQNDAVIGYLPQEVVLLSEKTVFEEVVTSSPAYVAITYEKEALEAKMAESADEETVERYTELLATYGPQDAAWAKESAEKILKGLGFSREKFDQPVSELSVGWKMRIVIAKLLLMDADFYLFDEPTNHLDLPAKEWFFNFLKNGTAGFLLVTHDRHYLDKACDYILALERGEGVFFTGNYTQYIEAEKQRRETLESAFERQQKDISRRQETIERFKAKASKAKMAQSMMKQLDKIERIELEPLEPRLHITFPPVERAGSIVLTVDNISHSFEGKELFKNVTSAIKRGEKVGLIAPNGTGKTTLFNLLTGMYALQHGTKEFGHNVKTAIFEQDQLKALDPRKTVYEEVSDSVINVPEGMIRAFLGSFLFSGETIKKKISVLSGGERNRVAMVKVLLAKANFLLLDEPTNHLDLFAKEVLLQALQKYEGSMLFVSHDHAFLQNLATRIWVLTPEGLIDYLGTYEEYLHEQEKTEQQPLHVEKKSEKIAAPVAPDDRKRLASLEKAIARSEQQIATLTESFNDLQFGTPEFDKASQELKKAQTALAESMNEWERMSH